jgi:hypothetical protein
MPTLCKKKKSKSRPPPGYKFDAGRHGFVPLDRTENGESTTAATASIGIGGGGQDNGTPNTADDGVIENISRDTARDTADTAEPNRKPSPQPVNEKVFLERNKKDPTKKPPSLLAGKKAQQRALKSLKNAFAAVGTTDHQTALLSKFLRSEEGRQIAANLGINEEKTRSLAVAKDIKRNVEEILDSSCGKSTNDAIGFRNTLILGIAPTAPPAESTDEQKLEYNRSVRNLCKELKLTRGVSEVVTLSGKKRQALVDDEKSELNYMQPFRKKFRSDRLVTDKMAERFETWLKTQCP